MENNLFTGIDSIIFDMDGTLFDSMYIWEKLCYDYLPTLNIEVTNSLIEKMMPLSISDLANYLKSNYIFNKSCEDIIFDITSRVKDEYFYNVELKPGALDLIKLLYDSNIKMCIATASDKRLAIQALKRIGIEKYFEFIITCADVGKSKNNSLIYDTAVLKLKSEKQNVLVFEDSLLAIKTATGNGYKVVGVYDGVSTNEQENIKKIVYKYIKNFNELKK